MGLGLGVGSPGEVHLSLFLNHVTKDLWISHNLIFRPAFSDAWVLLQYLDFPGGSVVKNSPANAGDTGEVGLIPGSG